jgi:N-acyl-phosphatidylethanolamine-hydrolysing phospholipase D
MLIFFIGYCTVTDDSHTINPALPVCPAFKEVGEKLGPFTLGLIPIGAYDPRHIFSAVHNAPIDAVRMFQDTVRFYVSITRGIDC